MLGISVSEQNVYHKIKQYDMCGENKNGLNVENDLENCYFPKTGFGSNGNFSTAETKSEEQIDSFKKNENSLLCTNCETSFNLCKLDRICLDMAVSCSSKKCGRCYCSVSSPEIGDKRNYNVGQVDFVKLLDFECNNTNYSKSDDYLNYFDFPHPCPPFLHNIPTIYKGTEVSSNNSDIKITKNDAHINQNTNTKHFNEQDVVSSLSEGSDNKEISLHQVVDRTADITGDMGGIFSQKQQCAIETDTDFCLYDYSTYFSPKKKCLGKGNEESCVDTEGSLITTCNSLPNLLEEDDCNTISQSSPLSTCNRNSEDSMCVQNLSFLPSSVAFEQPGTNGCELKEILPTPKTDKGISAKDGERSGFRTFFKRKVSPGSSRIRQILTKLSLKQTFTSLEQFVNNYFVKPVSKRRADESYLRKEEPLENESIGQLKINLDDIRKQQKSLGKKNLAPGYRDISKSNEQVEVQEESYGDGWVRKRVAQIEKILTLREDNGQILRKVKSKNVSNRKKRNGVISCLLTTANQTLVNSVNLADSDAVSDGKKSSIGDSITCQNNDSGNHQDLQADILNVENKSYVIEDASACQRKVVIYRENVTVTETSNVENICDALEIDEVSQNAKPKRAICEDLYQKSETLISEEECDINQEIDDVFKKDLNEDDESNISECSDAETTDIENEKEDDFNVVQLRRSSRVRASVRASIRASSMYRYSTFRPRSTIIALGRVCTETHFLSDSFGDGVSETESEDEEEDGAPVPHHHHHNQHHHHHQNNSSSSRPHSRGVSPTRRQSSRSHSPYSDMDTESKRNSQAISTEASEISDHSSVTTSDLESCHDPSSPRSSLLASESTHHGLHLDHAIENALDARKERAYRIALELLHTERTYVKVLHLIDQEFQFRVDNENRAHHMFPQDNIPHMFSNVKSIYKLHHDFLLPQLEDRMAQWEQNRRIGDIMKSFAPFLKMYTEYVRNFDNAMTLINQWQAKCPRFAAIMDEIHSMEVCGSLTLQHHMLSPVQRIPRYEMLLRDYLKKLPEESPDRHDTEKALQLVSMAANHANDAMKKIDKFEKLLEIQESLGGAVDLVSPTRELVKEGKIIKISARSGDHQERYVFLLTDLLLLCSPRLMGGRVMSGPQYRLRAKYNVENLQVLEGDNLETANTFYIRDSNKSVELYTQTKEEKELWLEALFQAIHETYQRKSSLKLHFSPDQRVVDVDLGQKQPTLVRSDSVTKCMECGSQFTMVRRKHHCRACGAVVCNKCSNFKASLAYESGKSVRVCRTCHTTLQELSSSTATPSPEIDDSDECAIHTAKEQSDLAFRTRGVLEVSAKTGGAVMEGFLQLKTHRKAWVKRWFALHTDFVLYSFKCEADEQALTATPVPGFTVTHLQGTRNESGIGDKEKERAFKLHHAKKHYIFQAASKDESQRWVAALKKASQAELPSPLQ